MIKIIIINTVVVVCLVEVIYSYLFRTSPHDQTNIHKFD